MWKRGIDRRHNHVGIFVRVWKIITLATISTVSWSNIPLWAESETCLETAATYQRPRVSPQRAQAFLRASSDWYMMAAIGKRYPPKCSCQIQMGGLPNYHLFQDRKQPLRSTWEQLHNWRVLAQKCYIWLENTCHLEALTQYLWKKKTDDSDLTNRFIMWVSLRVTQLTVHHGFYL